MSITFALAFSVGGLSQALASTSGVSSGNVKKGQTVELRNSYSLDSQESSDDNRFQLRQHYEYGVTDDYAIRLILTQDERESEDISFASFRFENRFQIYNKKEDGFNGAVRLGYRKNESGTDSVEIRLNGSIDIGDAIQYKQNLIFSHDVGEGARSGLAFEARFALEKKMGPITLGVDLFNDFGNVRDLSGFSDQSHEVGPYVTGNFSKSIYYQLGFRQGVSRDATDQSLRLFTGYRF